MVKIQINDIENYEINIPDNLNPQELLDLMSKLDRVARIIKLKVMEKTTIKDFNNSPLNLNSKKHYLNSKKYFNTKEKVLDIMQYFYHGTEKDKERISKIIGKPKHEISKRFFNLIRKYKIKPNEVGLIQFKNIRTQRPLLLMDCYTIKSYTGIFDE